MSTSTTLVETAYTIMRPGAPDVDASQSLPLEPGWRDLKPVISRLLHGASPEHVSVLHRGDKRDMFVDCSGKLKGLPRNDAATAIYRAATMAREPLRDPETLPAIYGTAVLFHRPVWF